MLLCPSGPLLHSHLIVVNISISCDHNSLLDPGLRNSTFDSLQPKEGAKRKSLHRGKEKQDSPDSSKSSLQDVLFVMVRMWLRLGTVMLALPGQPFTTSQHG